MAQSTPTPNELLDSEASLPLYDPAKYPGVGFTSTTSAKSWTSNGTVWIPTAGGGGVPASFYGDGSAGDVTIAVVSPLAADLYADHLVIQAGGDLQPNGWKIYAKTSIVIAAGGKVSNNGNAAVGNAAGAPTGKGSVVAEGLAGGKGGVGGPGNGGIAAIDCVVAPIGGGGGDGGDGGLNAGGLGGVAVTEAVAGNFHTASNALMLIPSGRLATAVIGAGTGGGGGGSDAGGLGGGGGGGAGIVYMATPSLTNDGTIEALGGTGGDGVAPNNQGGGGGGGGGVIFLVHEGPVLGAGTAVATGGLPGVPNAAGTPGDAGSAGTYFNFKIG